jgi:hypothetical protein
MTTDDIRDDMSPHPPDPRHPSHHERDEMTDGLLAVSRELGDTEQEGGWRSRSGTVRRRQRVVRGAAAQETEIRERLRVRSVTEEGVGGEPPPVRDDTPGAPEPGPTGMLDAQGNVIGEAAAGAAGAAVTEVTRADPGRFLADAVRSYLDGVEQFGVDHEVTRDRRAQLRRILDRYEQG